MKDILIVAHFTQVPGEQGNSRFRYIADILADKGYNIELVTTRFSHRTKEQRNVQESQLKHIKYKLTMLQEKGYRKNVSLKRFYSHYIFGENFRKYLENRKKPDIIYCAVPSLDAAFVAAKFAKHNNIKFIIDVQDLWPEAFKMVFNLPVISDLIFYPMNKKANFIYNAADEIVAVSETYVNRALLANKQLKRGGSIFLGTELARFDNLVIKNKVDKPKDEIQIAYIGTLGNSYDLIYVIDALALIKNKGINDIKFVVMGDGPLHSKFRDYAEQKQINVKFMGRLDYEKMVGVLVSCDIAVNPIKSNSAGSIINKVGDYAAAGLPVLNTQESEEYRRLIVDYNAGLNCKNSDPHDLAEKILILYNDPILRQKMGMNNRKLAEDKFDRKTNYKLIESLISSIL